MGLALCHTVPRDRLLQLVTLMLVVAFCLLAAAVGQRNRAGSLATLSAPGSSDLYLFVDGVAKRADTGVHVCSKDLDGGVCHDFVIKTRIGSLLVILGWIALTLSILATCFLITPLARHSYQIYLYLWLALTVPVALVAAGAGMLLGPGISNGVDLVAAGHNVHYGRSIRCVIAALVLVVVSFLIATFQLVATLGRSKLKQSHVEGRNIEEIMKMHIVNDDWTRQKMMWVKHAQAVDIELQQNQSAQDEGSITSAMEQPGSVTFKHNRTRSQAAADAMTSYVPEAHFKAEETA